MVVGALVGALREGRLLETLAERRAHLHIKPLVERLDEALGIGDEVFVAEYGIAILRHEAREAEGIAIVVEAEAKQLAHLFGVARDIARVRSPSRIEHIEEARKRFVR